MTLPLSPNPDINKDLVEERQREILKDVEAERIAEGEAVEGEYQPVTDNATDLVDTARTNRRVKKNR